MGVRQGPRQVFLQSSSGQLKQAVVSPDADHVNHALLAAIDYSKWWVDQLAKKRLVEFRDYPTQLWVTGKVFHSLQDLRDKSLTNLRNPLRLIPRDHGCQI